MTPSQRILLNTTATYGRNVFAMVLGLFSSRWVLHALGEVDFGLMGVVGAMIVFIAFFTGITSGACARFFAYSLGEENQEEINEWFNTALSIHTLIPFILIGIGYPVGAWAIYHFFNIPPERLNTAIWVFRFSLVSVFMAMICSPYLGMFTAKQRIYEMSFWGILQATCMFILAYFLTIYKGDSWLFYSAGSVCICVLFGIFQVLRAWNLFPECKICFSKWLNIKKIKELFSFASWQLFGGIGGLFRGQGIAILLNKYFNPNDFPHVNAAYNIGNNVSTQTQTFSSALLGAFIPEITACEGRGNREQMLILANRASKLGTMLVLLLAIPVMLEMDFILFIWLKNPPELAGIFATLFIFIWVVDRLTVGQGLAVNAVGKIAGYQAMLGGFLMLTLPLAWLFFIFGFNATSAGWAIVITTVMLSVGRIFWAKYLVGFSPLKWLKEVFIPCFFVLMTSAACGWLIQRLFEKESIFRLGSVLAATFVSTMLLGWFIVLNQLEKQFFIRNTVERISKLKNIKIKTV